MTNLTNFRFHVSDRTDATLKAIQAKLDDLTQSALTQSVRDYEPLAYLMVMRLAEAVALLDVRHYGSRTDIGQKDKERLEAIKDHIRTRMEQCKNDYLTLRDAHDEQCTILKAIEHSHLALASGFCRALAGCYEELLYEIETPSLDDLTVDEPDTGQTK